MNYFIGQFFGILASVLCILTPLFKRKWQMLAVNIATNILMLLNFVLIGEVGSAAFLCFVGSVQPLVTLIRTLRNTETPKWELVLFFCLYLGLGFFGYFTAPTFVWAFTWKNLLELLPIVGAVLNMAFVSIRDEQHARWCLLGVSSVWAIYTGIVGATTFFAEAALLVTTIAAMIRYRKDGKPVSK